LDNKENIFKVGFNELPIPISNNIFEVVETNDNFLTVKIHPGYQPADVLQFLLNNKASIISFNEILPSLNDIFIKKVADTQLARQFEKV
jgi:ABC-2 type transport system ATP-binding protein